MKKTIKKIIKYTRYVILILLLILIVNYLFKNKEGIITVFNNINYHYIPFLLFFGLLTSVFASRILYGILKRNINYLSWFDWYKIYVWGIFLNIHIPQSGNVYQAFAMKKQFKYKFEDFTVNFGIYYWLSLCINLLMGICFFIFNKDLQKQNIFYFLVPISLLFILIIISPFIFNYILKISERFKLFKFSRTFLIKSYDMVKEIKKTIFDLKLFTNVLLWTVLQLIASVFAFYYSFKCLNFSLVLSDAIPFVVLNNLIGTIKIVPGNFGIVEYLNGYLTSQFGLKIYDGIILSLFMRINGYIIFMIIFSIVLISNFKKRNS